MNLWLEHEIVQVHQQHHFLFYEHERQEGKELMPTEATLGLDVICEKIYGIIRDNQKKDLTSLLSLCIQVFRIRYPCTPELSEDSQNC